MSKSAKSLIVLVGKNFLWLLLITMCAISASTAQTPHPVQGSLFASVYRNQQHVFYRIPGGTIQDSWYDGATGRWNVQTINNGGHPAIGDPVASVYRNQQHVFYRVQGGVIQDSWYDGATGNWNLQQINKGGVTNGPAATGDPSPSVYNNQQHVFYTSDAGVISDSWYDGATGFWHSQQINKGGVTAGDATVGNPSASVYRNQQHVFYLTQHGVIQDSWWDGATNHWNLQTINLSGVTNGPAAAGDPSPSVYNNQQHVFYTADSGIISDSWYDGATGHWRSQQINLSGLTAGRAAMGNPVPSVYRNQQHVLYLVADGKIDDSWWDGPTNRWNLQQINKNGVTSGAAATSSPCASVYNIQQHVFYLIQNGIIQDSWWDGATNHWNLQIIPQ